jgi:hypothetical protein
MTTLPAITVVANIAPSECAGKNTKGEECQRVGSNAFDAGLLGAPRHSGRQDRVKRYSLRWFDVTGV